MSASDHDAIEREHLWAEFMDALACVPVPSRRVVAHLLNPAVSRDGIEILRLAAVAYLNHTDRLRREK